MTDNDLQTELSNTAELLAASTEARRMMADTIADLRTENGTLRAALKDALFLTAATLRDGVAKRPGYTSRFGFGDMAAIETIYRLSQ